MRDSEFHKKNIIRLKELSLDCPQCIQDRVMCHHYDYLKRYIEELEALPPFGDEQFAIFWKAYPRKVAKPYVEKIWKRMKVDDEMFQRIMAALELQKKSPQWTENQGRYIAHPSTWLNQERWDEETEQLNATGNKYDNI